MAKPDCDDGFLMLAIELFAVLATYGLRDREWAVLAWVLIQVYGPHKRRSVHLDFQEIGDYTGLGAANARRGANELIARGILTIDPTDRSATFSKYFARWAQPPSSRSIAFGQAAVTRFGTARKRKTGKVPRDSPDKTSTVQRDSKVEAPTVQRDCPHIEERAAEEFKNLERLPSEARTREDAAGGLATDDSMNGCISMPDGFADLCRRADSIDALKAVAFGPKLRGAWLSDGDFSAWWDEIPASLWQAALNDLAGKPADQRAPRFYLGIVKRLHRQHPSGVAPAPADVTLNKHDLRRREIKEELKSMDLDALIAARRRTDASR